MVWFKPWTGFSRNAQVVLANANTNVLKSALRNYIKAVNSLKPNMRTNQAITNLLNQANVNANNKRVIRNRLANGVAKIVFASRRGLAKAGEAVATGAPEGPAAEAVNTAAAKIKNLNNFMAGFKGGNANALTKYYTNSGRNYMVNRDINEKRNGGARYASLWANIAARPKPNVAAAFAELPGETAVSNEANRQAVINKALAEINAAGNNVNKLRGIKTRLNNAKFNRGQASTNAVAKYNSLTNKITANQALKNANALTPQSNQATINSVLNKLRKVQNRVPNTMRSRVANKIANVERQSLLKMPNQGN
jgi:hypothetical protein